MIGGFDQGGRPPEGTGLVLIIWTIGACALWALITLASSG